MPGNEAGDRVHNFFDQDNLSHRSDHSEPVERSWLLQSNSSWAGNQRQSAPQFSGGLENHNVHHSGFERGVTNLSFTMPYDLKLAQSNMKPDFVKYQSQNLQSNPNGYTHGHNLFQTRENESNFFEVGRAPDGHSLASGGFHSLETTQKNCPELKKDSMSLEADYSGNIKFDFLGGPQQMVNQPHGMFHSLPRHQSGFHDMQPWQQQAAIRQMQDLQRQQNIQQQQVNHMSSIGLQAGSNHYPLINGTPVHDGLNYPLTSEVMARNANWVQCGALSGMQGSSNGPVFSPVQDQAVGMLGLSLQGVDRSLYGFPTSSTTGPLSQYSHENVDNSPMQNQLICDNFFTGHQYAASDQVSRQEGISISSQGFDTENLFSSSPAQCLDSKTVSENPHQRNALPRITSVKEFQQREAIVDSAETLPCKTKMQAASSQREVALDPTEEKFLFGTDDNIWGAFAKSIDGVPDRNNPLDNTESQNGFSSLKSGSWSALMQSAVAETSCDHTGLKDECSGLTFPESVRSQPSKLNGSGKHQAILADNNLHTTPTVSRPLMQTNDASKSANTIIQQAGSTWKVRNPLQKPQAEGNTIYSNDLRPSDEGLREKSILGSPTHQETTSSYNTYSQTYNNANDLNFMGTTSSCGDAIFKLPDTQTSLSFHNNGHQRLMHEGVRFADVALKDNSTSGFMYEEPRMGSPPVNSSKSKVNNVATQRNKNITQSDQQTGQRSSNNRYIEYGKHADAQSNFKSGEGFGKYQHHLNDCPQVFEPSMSTQKKTDEMRHKDNVIKKEISNENRSSIAFHDASSGGVRENGRIYANEVVSLSGVNDQLYGQIGRKFQYHPMGNLDEDVDPAYGSKLGTLSQATSQLGGRGVSHYQGSSVQSESIRPNRKSSEEIDKGRLRESQLDCKALDETSSRSNFPGHFRNSSASVDRRIRSHTPIKAALSSQNMLELFHKEDHSTEHGNINTVPSEKLGTEVFDRFDGHLQQNRSDSQGFGLQLAPPSLRLPISNPALPFQSPLQTVHQTNQSPPETRDKGRIWATPTLTFSSKAVSQGQFNNKTASYNIQGNVNKAFASGFPNSRSEFYDKQISGSSVPTSQILVVESELVSKTAPPKPGISQQAAFSTMLPNAWTNNVSTQQHHVVGAQPHQASVSLLSSHLETNENAETTPLAPQTVGDQDTLISNDSLDPGKCSINSRGFAHGTPTREISRQLVASATADSVQNTTSASQDKESILHHQSHKCASNAGTAQRDLEAFGRSLKSDSKLHQNYALLRQMQAMKNVETNPTDKNFKIFEGSNGHPTGQKSFHGLAIKDTSINYSQLHSGDSNRRDSQDITPPGNKTSQGKPGDGWNNSLKESSGNDANSEKSVQINPRMATSWFNHFGTFKNGIPMYDVKKISTWKSCEQQYTTGRSADTLHTVNRTEKVDVAADIGQVTAVMQSSPSIPRESEQFSSSHLLLPAVTEPLGIPEPKKRKLACSGSLSWQKEVSQGFGRLLTLSLAEVEWAKSANRLVEKVEDAAEIMMDDAPSTWRPKRRLVLTTQLMQQLLHPPPPPVLTADSCSNYESVAYFVARLILGDACSHLSCSRSDSVLPIDVPNILPEKLKTSDLKSKQNYLKISEDFLGRVKKLEAELLRMNKIPSISALGVECEDMEKFSVINRFVKYHGRGQGDGAETSSPSVSTQTTFPQRYITTVPMSRNLPDRVKCLSL